MVDLAAAYRELKEAIDDAVARVSASGWYIGGPEVESFEAEWASYCGADHCVGVGNGLDALQLALRAMDVGPGDEVILASNSYIATVLAVSLVGATPVLIEPDPFTYNLDPQRIEVALTEHTAVVLPTHLYGQPSDLDAIIALARRHGLRVLEDAAQAHGALYKGKHIGAHGDAVAWSFYPTKNLGAMGDAGAVTTNDEEIARRIRLLGNYGSDRRYVNDVRGVNSRLDAIQAAVLSAKAKHLDRWNKRRASIAARYSRCLCENGLMLPMVRRDVQPAWHQYVIQLPTRDALSSGLKAAGVETLVHYPIAPHLQGAYADLLLPKGAFPIAERLADRVLSLPIHPHLSDEDIDLVVEATRRSMLSGDSLPSSTL